MTRRSFLANLGAACTVLGLPVAAMGSFGSVRGLHAKIFNFDEVRNDPIMLTRALVLSGKPKTFMIFLRASIAAGAPVPITYSTRIKPAALRA